MAVFIFTVISIEISVRNSVDPDQTPHLAASDLGLHCLHNTPKLVSGLKRVMIRYLFSQDQIYY